MYPFPNPHSLVSLDPLFFQESAPGSRTLLGTVCGSSKRTVTITKLSNGNGFLAIPKCHGCQEA